MRGVLLTILTLFVVGILGSASFIWFGIYDVSATRPHWPISY
jgi:hypothetical protein